jgi:hypothetical protein
MVIVCGSANSWILDNLINNHGGLYNRVTYEIKLLPFTLKECEEYYQDKQMGFSRYDVTQSYMIIGGIPYYMGYFKKGLGLAQNIDRLFFAENAKLSDEYNRLFASIFDQPVLIQKIIRFLYTRNYGYTRKEISDELGVSTGGWLSRALKALIASDFVVKYVPFGESIAYYKLTDPFCLFFLNFIEKPRRKDNRFWSNNHNSPSVNSWRGLAFENVCFKHIDQIKKALDIYGVHTTHSAWVGYDEELGGAQIDLILDRDDHILNLCEIKYLSEDYSVNAAYQRKLANRQAIIQKMISPKQVIHHTLITTYGLASNEYSSVFSNTITLEDLFLG